MHFYNRSFNATRILYLTLTFVTYIGLASCTDTEYITRVENKLTLMQPINFQNFQNLNITIDSLKTALLKTEFYTSKAIYLTEVQSTEVTIFTSEGITVDGNAIDVHVNIAPYTPGIVVEIRDLGNSLEFDVDFGENMVLTFESNAEPSIGNRLFSLVISNETITVNNVEYTVEKGHDALLLAVVDDKYKRVKARIVPKGRVEN